MLAGVQKGVRCRCPVVVFYMFLLGTGTSLYRYYFFSASILRKKHVFDNHTGLSE